MKRFAYLPLILIFIGLLAASLGSFYLGINLLKHHDQAEDNMLMGYCILVSSSVATSFCILVIMIFITFFRQR